MFATVLTVATLATLAQIPGQDPAPIPAELNVFSVNHPNWQQALAEHLRLVRSDGEAAVWTASPSIIARLQSLRATSIGNPTLLLHVGQPATVELGQEIPFQVIAAQESSGRSRRTIRDGIRLTCSGRVLDQGVLASVRTETQDLVSFDTQRHMLPDGRKVEGQYPTLARRIVAGEWLIPHNQVLVIGLGERDNPRSGDSHAPREHVVVLHTRAPRTARAPMRTLGIHQERVAFNFVVPGLDEKGPSTRHPMPAHLILRAPVAAPLLKAATLAFHLAGRRDQGLTDSAGPVATESTFGIGRPSSTVPPVPSRSIPQGFAANGAKVDLPPLPPSSHHTPPSVTDGPVASLQSHRFPPVIVPLPHPDNTGHATLAGYRASITPAPADPSSGSMELRGHVRIVKPDGTLIEADSAVIKAPAPRQEAPGLVPSTRTASASISADSYVEPPRVRTASPRDDAVSVTTGVSSKPAVPQTTKSDADVRSARVAVPLLGGILQIKVEVKK